MSAKSDKQFKRLPTTVRPFNYGITLCPDLKNFTFRGSEEIKVEIKEEIKEIVFNALEVDISVASFVSHINRKTIIAKKIEIFSETETVCLVFNEPLSVGTGILRLEFTGTLNDKLKGFYRSKYTSADGKEERYAAITQFEATDARRAFPCWDEPALKATFDITLVVPANRVALSNTNVISDTVSKDDPNLKIVKFATTPVMSTYLVAFIVGEFDYVEDRSNAGPLVRIYTPVGKKDQGLFALEVTVKALEYYNNYFKIAYPLPKLDLIAIPDLGFGAMENWGLITYREKYLLVDLQNTSSNTKQDIALVVAHELAHQWFGNLVTMEWWTHLWLNEGFASFIEYLCVDHLFPEYDIWTQFVADAYLPALELDALHNSHAIEVPVGHPSEIDEIFDTISYSKGAAVIRMLHRFIGNELFQKGMHLYLTRHSYGNTSTEDLWTALEESSNKPIRDVMSTWTKQKGFPVISVNSRNVGNSRILTLTQEKFCADGILPSSEANTLWMIPVSVIKGSNPTEIAVEVLMKSKTLEIEVPNVDTEEWIKLNPNSVGVYRVKYAPQMIELLLPAVSDKTLSPLDRLSLQNDLYSMVISGQFSTVDVLKGMEYFSNEDNYIVWKSIIGCLEKLDSLLSNTEFQHLFHEFGRKLLSKVHSLMGWEPIKGETHLDGLLRTLVIKTLVSFGDQTVINYSKKLFEAHTNPGRGTYAIPPDFRPAVYKAVAMDCEDKTFNDLIETYRGSDLHEEKSRICAALGCVTQPNRIAKALEFSLSEEVRHIDAVLVIIATAMTKCGRDMAWDFFKQHKDELKRRYEGGFLVFRLVKAITENFASEERAQEVKDFFTKNPFPGSERTVKQSLETILMNTKWLARDVKAIQNFFKH